MIRDITIQQRMFSSRENAQRSVFTLEALMYAVTASNVDFWKRNPSTLHPFKVGLKYRPTAGEHQEIATIPEILSRGYANQESFVCYLAASTMAFEKAGPNNQSMTLALLAMGYTPYKLGLPNGFECSIWGIPAVNVFGKGKDWRVHTFVKTVAGRDLDPEKMLPDAIGPEGKPEPIDPDAWTKGPYVANK